MKTQSRLFGISKWKAVLYFSIALLATLAVLPRGYAMASFPYTKTFVISSYYSPLPNQTHYATGTYEGDIRLNGEGVHTADGSTVYPGTAAASREFAFGTKLDIPGFGIVTVHDRGGAINGNRIDIWVGHGEEGLRRALAWGMQSKMVTVYGIDDSKKETVDFTNMPLARLDVIAVARTSQPVPQQVSLNAGDSGESVKLLQHYLKKLGYYKGTVTGFFSDETVEAVKAFQVHESVVASESDGAAGVFGPRSKTALEVSLARNKTQYLAKLPVIILKKGMTGGEVEELQRTLQQVSFLKKVTGTFDQDTINALTKFQIDTGVIKNGAEVGAGIFGPKTQATMRTIIAAQWTPSEPIQLTSTTDTNPQYISKELALNSTMYDVVALQEILTDMHFYGLPSSGFYGKTTEHAVFKFQQAFGIVQDEKDSGAGVVGPKTIAVLNKIAESRTAQKNLVAHTTIQHAVVSERIEQEKSLIADAAVPKDGFEIEMIQGSRGTDVERLQRVLKQLGFFQGRVTTEYFGDRTTIALRAFQKSHSLEETGALDERTRALLNALLQVA